MVDLNAQVDVDGDDPEEVAQGWLVLVLTGDPLWLGLIAVAQFGPVLLLGLFGGVVADHLPKRRTLLVTQFLSMVLAFALFGLTVTDVVEVWHVAVLAVLVPVALASGWGQTATAVGICLVLATGFFWLARRGARRLAALLALLMLVGLLASEMWRQILADVPDAAIARSLAA